MSTEVVRGELLGLQCGEERLDWLEPGVDVHAGLRKLLLIAADVNGRDLANDGLWTKPAGEAAELASGGLALRDGDTGEIAADRLTELRRAGGRVGSLQAAGDPPSRDTIRSSWSHQPKQRLRIIGFGRCPNNCPRFRCSSRALAASALTCREARFGCSRR